MMNENNIKNELMLLKMEGTTLDILNDHNDNENFQKNITEREGESHSVSCVRDSESISIVKRNSALSPTHDTEPTESLESGDLLSRVKQEPLEKQKLLEELQQVVVVIQEHTETKRMLCQDCNQRFRKKHSFVKHLVKYHAASNPSLLPDANDPDYYCKVCDRIFYAQKHFLRHLQTTHKMVVEKPPPVVKTTSQKIKRLRRKELKPEPQFGTELVYHCRLCDRSIATKRRFLSHVRRVHHILKGFQEEVIDVEDGIEDGQKGKEDTGIESPDANTSSQLNNDDTTVPNAIAQPMSGASTPTQKKTKTMMYDVSALTMKCRYCPVQGLSQNEYREHLKENHQDHLNSLVSNIVQPKDKKAEVFCTTCEMKMEVLGDCVKHMRQKHDLKVFPDPKFVIDRAANSFQQSQRDLPEEDDGESFAALFKYFIKTTAEKE